MTPPEEGQVTKGTRVDAYGRAKCSDCGGWFEAEPDDLSEHHICGPMVVRLLKERDEARLEARAATEVAIQKLRFGMYQNQELSDKETLGLWKAIEAEKQRLMDGWKKNTEESAL